MSVYQDAVARRADLEARLSNNEVAYQQVKRQIGKELREVNAVLNVAESGFDAQLFLTARELLVVSWGRYGGESEFRRHSEIPQAIEDAVEDLRAGGPKLGREYIGIKQYEQWSGQRSDHPYGYGPKHGSVWFRIELTGEFRRQDRELTDKERIACIAWLRKIAEDPTILAVV